jgi:hypothetical protein
LAAVYERLQEVLLGVVIVVDDVGHPPAELRQVLHILIDPIISHIIGSRLGPQEPVIADVLLRADAKTTTHHIPDINHYQMFDGHCLSSIGSV